MPPNTNGPGQRRHLWERVNRMISVLKGVIKQVRFFRVIHRIAFRVKVYPRLVRLPLFLLLRVFGLRTLSREDLLANAEKFGVKRFGEDEVVSAGPPVNLDAGSEEARLKLRPFRIELPRPFIVEIPDALLAGPSATCFTRDGTLLLETLTPNDARTSIPLRVPASSLLLSRLPAAACERVECLFSLAFPWSNNFFHWLADNLPRLEGCEFYERETGRRPMLLVPASPNAWQRQSLELLGYSPDRWLPWKCLRLRADRLVLSSYRREYNAGNYGRNSLNSLRWLREKMLGSLAQRQTAGGAKRKTYISRRKALARCVINEEEVLATLVPLGFEMHELEDLSFSEQVRLFAETEFLVAPHGAGLVHVIFSENLKLLELFGPSIQPLFSEIARGLGHRYAFLECPAPPGDLRTWDANMVVNITALKQCVEEMLA